MKFHSAIFGFAIFSDIASAYFIVSIFAPEQPGIDAKVVNARDKAFVIGADSPTTYCGLDDTDQCPDGETTLINAEMTLLAVRSCYLPPYGGKADRIS